MLLKVALNDFCIPDFQSFKRIIQALFIECNKNDQGAVASYIPQLANVDPNQWAVSICTVDGQRLVFFLFAKIL